MNKAEEQLLVLKKRLAAQYAVIQRAQNYRDTPISFASKLKERCEEYLSEGNQSDYYTTIIHSIDGGQIKDWPSFVEYMTGEDYEQKPKCEYCNDTKEVSAPHYTKGGEIPDCDFIKCPKCGGKDE